ncbi:MAG: hypothetical protein COX02_00665 [Candidatus Vogelbacteria bacterium CG22_combo_CG10-13_8_21_14_all_37_9]|uniref:Uncharacterized protein n=1 Tax=Candidatus Vogelbacteria bacterium CG22_combo_CG10-13_8_21_14_all_37_9 TaxID=1975046 RepID=A0A2H0BL80_9BACT|nr:MAG: hypothetical protein BK005_00585 [bacterium CG10_37_50]PIP58354.1 MAG: hypothetical protein COX02_00665 [Candidatus Vogelbacteria bacterium CG22_combo_CG10-13_8_21_14_all_37_9]
MNKDLSQKIITKIKTDKIVPRPRWQFLVLNSAWWFLFTLSTFLGVIVFSLLFKNIADNDWQIYSAIGKTLTSKIFFSLPYLWLILLILIIYLAWRELKQTRGAYRHNLTLILAGSLSLSFFLGGLTYQLGFSDRLERGLSTFIPQYQIYQIRSSGLWDKPEIGFLAGEITVVSDANNFLLKDVDKKIWIIEGQNIVWTGQAKPKVRSLVKISGFLSDDHHFVAQSVRLWQP